MNINRHRYCCRIATILLALLPLASSCCHGATAQLSSIAPSSGTEISPSQAPAVIDSVMAIFYKMVYLPASSVQATGSGTKVSDVHPSYPKYGQWLTNVATAIKGNIELHDHVSPYDDLSAKAMLEFKDLTSRAEFPPTKDVDMQEAQIEGLDLRVLGARLADLFHNQPAQTRKAAAAYLIRHYKLP
jgi:hypothetical protein